MAQGFVPYGQYPGPGTLAVKLTAAGDFFGFNNYQVGGYNLNAASLGMSRLEFVQFAHYAQSGNFYARAFYPAVSGNAETGAPSFAYVKVKWFDGNNNEVGNNTNLSAECTQILAIGI